MSGTPKKTSSSPYQVLGNRPIDQWKVTELKEELKRRKLITRGLKDELVKRLDEALRIERESEAAVAEADLNGVSETQGQDIGDNVTTPEKAVVGIGKHSETPQKDEESNMDKTDEEWVKVNAVECLTFAGELNEEAVGFASHVLSVKEEVIVVQKTVVETVTETVVTETPISAQGLHNETANSEVQNDQPVYLLENESSKLEIGAKNCEGSETQKDIEKPVQVDSVGSSPNVSGFTGLVEGSVKIIETQDEVPASGQQDAPFRINQVSEVSSSLGLEVKIGSVSSDSVSIVEKNELKDNITADNVKNELNVKPEMVQPSSVNVAPDAGESQSHPMDVEYPLEKKLSADYQDGNTTFVDKTNAEIEYSEKLNLDRSSGDDSMDEDAFDNKQMDTKTTSNVYDENNEQVKVEIKVETIVDIAREGKENDMVEDKGVVAAEKRKLPGQQSTGNNEPVKRQRKWNTESVKVSEPQTAIEAVRIASKESISPAVGRQGLLKPDSSEDATKERVVSPSANPPTNSLRIDRFLRPFTLKAVQELLGKTGKVISFWMDQIKTHCYITYSSVEEATETRNAVYNLQWPTNGGRLLVADFVDPQEVKNRIELPSPRPSAPLSAPPPPQAAAPAKQPQPSPRQVQRQQHALQTAIPPPPPIQENVEPPIVTLDDLFRKTNTLPRIYYLPLPEERVAEKIAARGKNVKT